jgi:signal transduction histidine kinase
VATRERPISVGLVNSPRLDRASPLWTRAAILTALLALAAGSWAVVNQYLASKPVGEGELFAHEVNDAGADYEQALAAGTEPGVAARHARNDLGVVSVSVVDRNGQILSSTSENLVGSTLSGFLAGAVEDQRFAAIAQEIDLPVSIDGVEEWFPGDVLYRVFAPLSDGSGLVVEYDVSALLARRARQAAVRPANLLAGGLAIFLLAGTAVLLVARQGAHRRAAETAVERRFLEERSTELEQHNQQLEDARGKAEKALALAEETNRVRSEFVLMINHELRTPLTSVVTGSQLLAGSWDSLAHEDRQRLLADIVADGRRLKELITQMLVVARVENRSLQYELRHVTADMVRTRLEGLSPRTPIWPAGTHVPPLLTDLDTLSYLLVSLADNARTHGARNVEIMVTDGLVLTPQIEVGTRPAAAAYFIVRDDGPGIEAGFISHIFEKFEKRGRASGTGLGLYLARLMVEGIDGSIAVTSDPTGTTMAVAVPLLAQKLRVAS